jgi:L-methionine (R)-S-oxide reductase
MAETLEIDKKLTTEETYKNLIPQLKSLLSKESKQVTNLANLAAALKQTFDKISWVGFYLFDSDKLYLGPFQGKIACTEIALGKGVCGRAAIEKQTIIVPNVNEFPGHILCDPDSKSEIVIPIIKNKLLFGVLDIDSSDYNSFNKIDEKYLNEICDFLSTLISFD